MAQQFNSGRLRLSDAPLNSFPLGCHFQPHIPEQGQVIISEVFNPQTLGHWDSPVHPTIFFACQFSKFRTKVASSPSACTCKSEDDFVPAEGQTEGEVKHQHTKQKKIHPNFGLSPSLLFNDLIARAVNSHYLWFVLEKYRYLK